MDLGFLGLGQMGAAIAERLQDGGRAAARVRSESGRGRTVRAARRGRSRNPSPRSPTRRAIVFACLPDAATSQAVAAEVAAGQGAARLCGDVDHRQPDHAGHRGNRCARRASRWSIARSAAVPKGARAGTLSVIAAGPPAALAQVRRGCDRIGKTVFVVGEAPGQAQLMKLVNNLINAANLATAFEALVLGAKGGLDPDLMVQVINVSTGRNSATQDKVPRAVLPGTFDYGAGWQPWSRTSRWG